MNDTLLEILRAIDPTISEKQADSILWNETAFPFRSGRMLYKQLTAAGRAHRNKISRCELCGMKLPYHKYCIERIVAAVKRQGGRG